MSESPQLPILLVLPQWVGAPQIFGNWSCFSGVEEGLIDLAQYHLGRFLIQSVTMTSTFNLLFFPQSLGYYPYSIVYFLWQSALEPLLQWTGVVEASKPRFLSLWYLEEFQLFSFFRHRAKICRRPLAIDGAAFLTFLDFQSPRKFYALNSYQSSMVYYSKNV